jgi:serine/threonine protein kinase
MAPEVVNGSVCAKSDVWALSMTVMQLLTGKPHLRCVSPFSKEKKSRNVRVHPFLCVGAFRSGGYAADSFRCCAAAAERPLQRRGDRGGGARIGGGARRSRFAWRNLQTELDLVCASQRSKHAPSPKRKPGSYVLFFLLLRSACWLLLIE